jgi:hypothetical protein
MLPGSIEHGKRMAQAVSAAYDAGCGNDAGAVCDAMRSAGEGPSAADYETHILSSEYQEIAKENTEIDRRNNGKKTRLCALRKGENVNFRRDRCDGDPNITG